MWKKLKLEVVLQVNLSVSTMHAAKKNKASITPSNTFAGFAKGHQCMRQKEKQGKHYSIQSACWLRIFN